MTEERARDPQHVTGPGPARLEEHFSVEPFGGSILHLADINGDGRQELLILQSAGLYSSEIDGGSIDAMDRKLYCLTALSLEGKVLWQRGEPYGRTGTPFISHAGTRSLLAEDVDGDGHCEVLTAHAGNLAMYDGRTGEDKASTSLPSDNYIVLSTARLDPSEKGRQIVCKVTNRAYPPWPYANPVTILNPDLSTYAEPFAVPGAGHNLVAMDLDKDGRDELLIGYSLLHHDLGEVWRIDFGEGFDYVQNHADDIAVSDLNGDGEPEIRYSGSRDFFVADCRGNILWGTHAGHSQMSVAGPWGPGGRMRIIMSEKNRGLWGLDADGNRLWNRTDINGYACPGVRWHREGTPDSWAIFQPQLAPLKSIPTRSKPEWSQRLWPSFMDGEGRLHRVLPWRAEYAHPSGLIRAHRSYDCGLVYQVLSADLNRDGLDEILVYNRHCVWIFSAPEVER